MPLKRPDNAAFANENVYTFIRIIINNFGTASFNVNALTHRINKSQTDPYGHIGGSKRHLPRTFHKCPLKVPNKYF